MENALQSVMELSRDPVLALKNGTIAYMNAAALRVFPRVRVGDGAGGLLPDPILLASADRFVSGVTIGDVRYTVSAQRCGDTLFLTLEPDALASEARGCLSDGLMSAMLSTLFNIGMASDRLRAVLPQEAAEGRKYLALLDHNYYALLHKLRNLNMLLSLREGGIELSLCYVDLAALCADIVSSVGIMTRGKYAPIEYSCELETMPARMDAPKVEHLVLNLLTNSLRNTPKDGRVLLRLAKSGSCALISVSDTGGGIPPAQLKTAFTGFRGRDDLDALCADSGARLGLALCRVIAEKHGGTLIVEGREGEGTDVRALIPLVPPESVNLMSSVPEYTNGGMGLILTELSELLDADAYTDFIRD